MRTHARTREVGLFFVFNFSSGIYSHFCGVVLTGQFGDDKRVYYRESEMQISLNFPEQPSPAAPDSSAKNYK